MIRLAGGQVVRICKARRRFKASTFIFHARQLISMQEHYFLCIRVRGTDAQITSKRPIIEIKLHTQPPSAIHIVGLYLLDSQRLQAPNACPRCNGPSDERERCSASGAEA